MVIKNRKQIAGEGELEEISVGAGEWRVVEVQYLLEPWLHDVNCHNSSNRTPKTCAFYCMLIISLKKNVLRLMSHSDDKMENIDYNM